MRDKTCSRVIDDLFMTLNSVSFSKKDELRSFLTKQLYLISMSGKVRAALMSSHVQEVIVVCT